MSCIYRSDKLNPSLLTNICKIGPAFTRIEIVHDGNDQALSQLSKELVCLTHNNFGLLSTLITDPLLAGEPISIQVLPSNQSQFRDQDSSLHLCDTLVFDGAASHLRIILTHQSCQRVPGLQNNASTNDYISVKKLKDTKKGHGAKYYATYSYKLDIDLAMLTDPEKAKVLFIVDKIFHDVEIEATSFQLGQETRKTLMEKYGLNEQKYTTKTTAIPKHTIDAASDALVVVSADASGDLLDLYEYLNLALLNSSQLTGRVDSYVSTYESPIAESTVAEDGDERVTKSTIIGPSISSSVLSSFNQAADVPTRWKVLSIHSINSHVLIHRRDEDTHTWICKN